MKKTILSLMLSASILTASPLFAMEDPNETLHKTAIKRTAPIDSIKKAKAAKDFQRLQRAYDNSCMRTRDHRSEGTLFEVVISPHCEQLRQLMDQAYKNMKKTDRRTPPGSPQEHQF